MSKEISKFKEGEIISFNQRYTSRPLSFKGRIHDIDLIDSEIVYHVEVLFTDGTLWALVREKNAVLVNDEVRSEKAVSSLTDICDWDSVRKTTKRKRNKGKVRESRKT